jgi:hypothetical protein
LLLPAWLLFVVVRRRVRRRRGPVDQPSVDQAGADQASADQASADQAAADQAASGPGLAAVARTSWLGRRGRRWLTGGLVLLAVVALLGRSAVPTEAPPATRPPAGAGPVLPRVFADQRLVPPRAFDAVGRPRTAAVGIVFLGTVAGRGGTYATDAATGATVRLDDLPDLGGRDSELAVSPNGRYLVTQGSLVDLTRASVTSLTDLASRAGLDRPAIQLMPGLQSHSAAVLDDGTVVLASADGAGRLYAFPPAGSGRPSGLVTGVPGVASVEAADGARVVVRLFGAAGQDRELTRLVDLSVVPATTTVLADAQGGIVAVRGRTVVRGGPDGLVRAELGGAASGGAASGGAASGGVGSGGIVTGGVAIQGTGGADAGWLAGPVASPTLVLLGPASGVDSRSGSGEGSPDASAADADLAVLRTVLSADGTGSAGSAPVELTRVDPAFGGGLTDVVAWLAVAPGVVAQAHLVDPPAEPWWARFSRAG